MNNLGGKCNKNGVLSLVFFGLSFLSMIYFQGSGSLFGVAVIILFGSMAARYTLKYMRNLRGEDY